MGAARANPEPAARPSTCNGKKKKREYFAYDSSSWFRSHVTRGLTHRKVVVIVVLEDVVKLSHVSVLSGELPFMSTSSMRAVAVMGIAVVLLIKRGHSEASRRTPKQTKRKSIHSLKNTETTHANNKGEWPSHSLHAKHERKDAQEGEKPPHKPIVNASCSFGASWEDNLLWWQWC